MSALADLRGFAPNRRAAPDFAPNLERLKSTRDAAGPLGLTLVPAEARGLDALEQAFATMIGERAQALTVLSDGGAVQLSSHSGRRSDRIEPLFAAVHESAVDAVDGSSTGTSVPWMWALLRLPRFRGASHADDDDNRFRYRQVGFPGSRR
jgi:hypothetical protein